MLLRRDFRHTFRAMGSIVAAACLFTACASSEVEHGAPDATAQVSDADILLDEAVPAATAVSDAGAFADLEAVEKPSTTNAADSTSQAAAATMVDDSSHGDEGSPYYNSLGGESLRRVARTLYSDKSFTRKLLEKNPALKNVKKLEAEQKVFFDIESVKPEPTYLTKDLLNRYSGQLAERVKAAGTESGIAQTEVTLNKGETLQELSKRLYGTSRYWTEIFLVNHDQIRNYDKVKSGMTLTVFNRPNTGVANAAAPAVVAARVEEHPPPPPTQKTKPVAEVVPVEMPTQPKPVEVSQPQPDPIPESSAAVEPPRAPAPMVEAQKIEPAPVMHEQPMAEISSSNALSRPIIYGVLVLLILGGGFYFTRAPKRSKLDMLDITAADGTSRPKLAPKDTQQSNIG